MEERLLPDGLKHFLFPLLRNSQSALLGLLSKDVLHETPENNQTFSGECKQVPLPISCFWKIWKAELLKTS